MNTDSILIFYIVSELNTSVGNSNNLGGYLKTKLQMFF